MAPFAAAVALWAGLNAIFGLFAYDKKLRCEQGKPLEGMVCPEKPGKPQAEKAVEVPAVSLAVPVSEPGQMYIQESVDQPAQEVTHESGK